MKGAHPLAKLFISAMLYHLCPLTHHSCHHICSCSRSLCSIYKSTQFHRRPSLHTNTHLLLVQLDRSSPSLPRRTTTLGLDYYLSIHSLDISRRSIPPGIQSDAAATTTTTTTIANPSGVLVRGWQRATSARSLGRAVYLGMCCLPTSAKLFSLTLPAYITIAMAPPPNPHQS